MVPSSIDQPPVHIGFADAQARDCGRCRTATLRSVTRTVSVLAAAGTERPSALAVGHDERDAALLDQLADQLPINAIELPSEGVRTPHQAR